MAEKDYKAFQKFHAELVQSQLLHEKHSSDLEEAVASLTRKLAKETWCQPLRT